MSQGGVAEDRPCLPAGGRRSGPKTFRCGDVVPGCVAEFDGTENQILGLAAVHSVRGHGAQPDEELVQAVRRAIREV